MVCVDSKLTCLLKIIESELAGVCFLSRDLVPVKEISKVNWLGLIFPHVPITEISKVSWLGLASPTGCNPKKYNVGTRNLESELVGGDCPLFLSRRSRKWADWGL